MNDRIAGSLQQWGGDNDNVPFAVHVALTSSSVE